MSKINFRPDKAQIKAIRNLEKAYSDFLEYPANGTSLVALNKASVKYFKTLPEDVVDAGRSFLGYEMSIDNTYKKYARAAAYFVFAFESIQNYIGLELFNESFANFGAELSVLSEYADKQDKADNGQA